MGAAGVLANELLGVVYMLFVRRELGFEPGTLGMLFAVGTLALAPGASWLGAALICSSWAMLAGAGLGGLLGDSLGPRLTIVVASGLFLATALAWWAFAPRADARAAA